MDELLDRLDALAPPATAPQASPPPTFIRAVRRRRLTRRLAHAAGAATIFLAGALLACLSYIPTPVPTGRGPTTAQNPAPTVAPTVAPAAPTFALLRRLNADSDRLVLPPAPPGGSPEQVLTLGRGLDPALLRDWLGDS